MADTRNAIETDRRGLLSDEIQELSKQEMEDVTGGLNLPCERITISQSRTHDVFVFDDFNFTKPQA